MIVVNLFAGPNAGKTTLRALVFALLKMAGGGYDIEEAVEVAKEHVRERREVALRNRIKMLGDQYHRVFRLDDGNVDVVVNDSPVLLNAVYGLREGMPQSYADLCLWAHRQHPSFNVFVERNPAHGFQQAGRREDEAESIAIDGEIRSMLVREGIPFIVAPSGYEGARRIVEAVLGYAKAQRAARAA